MADRQRELELELELRARGTPAKKESPLPVPYFRGISYAQPPSASDIASGERLTRELFRGVPADVVSAPLQLIAGVGDWADSAVRKVIGAHPATGFASAQVVNARNRLAGRDSGSGPLTGISQGLATFPMTGPRAAGAFIQGVGLGTSEVEPGANRFEEGLKSGATQAIFNTAGNLVSKRVPASQAENRLRDIAKREGIDTTYGMQSGNLLAKNMEARAERNILLGGIGTKNYAQATHEAIDDQFAKALWRRSGQNFKEFTQDNIVSATKNIGNRLNAPFAKSRTIPFDGKNLQGAVDDAVKGSYNMSRPDELLKAAVLVDDKIAQGSITASDLNVIADDLRGLARKAYDDNNSAAGKLISNLHETLRAHAIDQIPTQAGKYAYKRALKEWANLQIIKDAFVRSSDSARGNIDYSKLKAAIERNMPGGYSMGRADMTDLADLGLSMRGTEVLNEGLKANPIDAALYLGLNSKASRVIRDSSPLDPNVAKAIMRAAGIETTVP